MHVKALPFVTLAAALLSSAAPTTAPAIRMNQLGFRPADPKRAILVSDVRSPLKWALVDEAGTVRMQGMSRPFGDAPEAGEHIHQVDFGAFDQAGSGYRLRVDGQDSRPFTVKPDALASLKYDALAYFYHNRAGTPIEARFAGGERWARPAGHPREIADCFAGKDTKGNDWPGCDYALDVTGGWYDAGDHGKYVVNGGIALWTLLNLYERQSARGLAPFADGRLSIPEAGNGIDDLLDHGRWQMEFMLAMQVPQGRQAQVPVGQKRPEAGLRFTAIDAGGMAHHKAADERWTGLPTAPHLDPEKRLLYPPTTAATLNLAATAAQCARIWRSIDPAFSSRCRDAATRAYDAARRNPEVYAAGDWPGSGNYGDGDLADEFYWAAAELFATTGNDEYARALRFPPGKAFAEPSWPEVAALGTITLALSSREEERDAARARLVAMADAYLADAGRSGYGIPYAPSRYPWGSNSTLLNRAIVLGYAYDFTRELRYRVAVSDALDYVLGRNPLDQSYVSGYGARPLQNPHHRFWAHQSDPRFPPPPSGAVSGGPNSISFSDDIARLMRSTCAPQKCWVDHIGAFTMNEVAINWNAPLVWVAAFADEP